MEETVANAGASTNRNSSRMKLLFPLERLYESDRFPLIFSGLYFAVIFLFAFTFHKIGDFGVESDFFGSYVPQARDFLAGKIGIDPFHGPLYPLVLALIDLVVGDLFKTGIIISAISGALSLYFIFEIVKSLFSPDVAFVSGVLVAVSGPFVQYSYTAGTDMFYVALSLAGLFMLFRKPAVTVVQLCLSAACMSFACLVRYNGIVFLLAVPLIILLRSIQVEGLTKYSAALIWVITFVALVAPWSIYLKINRGSFFYNENYSNIAYEVFAKRQIDYKSWSQYANQYTSFWDVISKNPLLFAWAMFKNIFVHLFYDLKWLTNFFVGIPSIIGGLLFAFSHPDRKKVGLILVFLSHFVVLLTVFYWNRLSLFLLPMYSIFFVFLFKYLLSKFGNKKFALTVLFNSLVAIVILVSYADSYSFNSDNISSGPKDILLISDWFHKEYGNHFDNAKIAAMSYHVPYFFNMRLYIIPIVHSYDSLVTDLKKNDVKFFYYGEVESVYRPQFLGLFKIDTVVHPGLKPLCLTHKPPAVLYEVTN